MQINWPQNVCASRLIETNLLRLNTKNKIHWVHSDLWRKDGSKQHWRLLRIIYSLNAIALCFSSTSYTLCITVNNGKYILRFVFLLLKTESLLSISWACLLGQHQHQFSVPLQFNGYFSIICYQRKTRKMIPLLNGSGSKKKKCRFKWRNCMYFAHESKKKSEQILWYDYFPVHVQTNSYE